MPTKKPKAVQPIHPRILPNAYQVAPAHRYVTRAQILEAHGDKEGKQIIKNLGVITCMVLPDGTKTIYVHDYLRALQGKPPYD